MICPAPNIIIPLYFSSIFNPYPAGTKSVLSFATIIEPGQTAHPCRLYTCTSTLSFFEILFVIDFPKTHYRQFQKGRY